MSAARTIAERWPSAAWDVAVLRGLDERGQRELEAAGRLRRVGSGEAVFTAGEPADCVVVVVAGEVELGGRAGRVARRGELVGEEAMVALHGARATTARARGDVTVAELPATLLRRVLGRQGTKGVAERVLRALRRAAARDVLRATSFGAALAEETIGALLDVVRHVHVARGDVLFREGEDASEVLVVGSGMLALSRERDGRRVVTGYLDRGDVACAADARCDVTATAPGPAWVLAVPRAAFSGLVRARRDEPPAGAPRRRLRVLGDDREGALPDLHRLRMARSLLVIDQEACVRCGHCAWSCASAHEDGLARIVRRGGEVVVAEASARAALLLPQSCQHCRQPACLAECPTGALTRDARGDVHIREALCTGCGACARACPWESVQIVPRARDGEAPLVAVKCDLCASRAGGPACVSGCPTEAILREDPNDALALLAEAPDRAGAREGAASSLPPRTRAWPGVAAAALASVGVAAMLARSRGASGAALAVVLGLLGLGVLVRRVPRLAAKVARVPGVGPRAGRLGYVAHLALGLAAVALALVHVGASPLPADAAGALAIAFGALVATGALLGLAYAVVPPRLARLERVVVLPEELPARIRETRERLFGALTGRSEVVKAIYARVLAPYVGARLGAAALAVSGRSLDEERARVDATARALLAGRTSERLAGLDELVRLAVEHRSARTVRLLAALLRGALAPHVVAAAIAAVLLAVHLVHVLGGGR